jgi:DHA1 family bicyclomycin/chloramphenicol resistance-like MFS transporter
MIGWRVVQAVGACAGPLLARAMVRDLYAGERSAQMLSTLITVMAVALLLGPILGGQVLAICSWRGIFWTIGGLGLLGLIGLLALPETLPPRKRSPRLIGLALAGGVFYGGIFAYIAGTPFAYIDCYHVPPAPYGLLFGLAIVDIRGVNLLNARLVMRFGSDRLVRFGTGVAALAGVAAAC